MFRLCFLFVDQEVGIFVVIGMAATADVTQQETNLQVTSEGHGPRG
jgi:hypothetical protein